MLVGSSYALGADEPSPPVHTAVLDNGLRVIFGECPVSATVACNAFIQISAIQESSLTAGIRQLIQLMMTGPTVTGPEPPEAQPPVGINPEGTTTRDYVEVIVQCLPEDFSAALVKLRRRVFEGQFTIQQFQIARQRLRYRLAASQEIPVSLALDTLVRRLYSGQPGSWPPGGSFAAAGAVRLEQAQRFYEQHFLPNATTIIIAGPLAWEQVLSLVKETFESLLPGHVNRQPRRFSPRTNLPRHWRAAISGSNSSIVVMGGQAPVLSSPDYPVAAVLTTLLGSGMGSRLYQSLRHERALAYSTEAGLTPSRVCSYAYVLATCSASDIDTIQQLIDEQLRDISQQGPSAKELRRAQRYLRGSFALNQQSSRDLAHYLGMFAVSGGSEGLLIHRQFPRLVAAVSSQDVQEACHQIFNTPTVVILEATGLSQTVHWDKALGIVGYNGG